MPWSWWCGFYRKKNFTSPKFFRLLTFAATWWSPLVHWAHLDIVRKQYFHSSFNSITICLLCLFGLWTPKFLPEVTIFISLFIKRVSLKVVPKHIRIKHNTVVRNPYFFKTTFITNLNKYDDSAFHYNLTNVNNSVILCQNIFIVAKYTKCSSKCLFTLYHV